MVNCDAFIAEWKEAVKTLDYQKIESLFAPHAVFYSPAVLKPYTQKKVYLQILKWVIEIIKEFEYLQTYTNEQERTICLLFQGYVTNSSKKLQIQGVDLFKLDETGKITELKVMLRPLNSTMEVASQMKKNFSKL